MCGIAGFCNPSIVLEDEKNRWLPILDEMNRVQRHRGPDDEGVYLKQGCGLAHVRLKIIDLVTGHQPMTCRKDGGECTIVYNGEIYNMPELKEELLSEGAVFETESDTEVILQGYLRYGEEYVKKLNGIFAFAIWDSRTERLFLFRDRLGVKPLFYTMKEGMLVFSSEIKGLFAYPGVKPILDRDGLCEIFALGPAKSYGRGVFQGVREVLPGEYLCCSREGIQSVIYWKLESHLHEDSFDETVAHTAWLVEDSVKKQMLSDIPVSTFLSGGIDSSLVTAICARELHRQGKVLNTFSFDFQDNSRYFRANAFQPGEDRPWVEKMIESSQTNHRFLECSNILQYEYLFKAVDARDLPCMADVESSMLYFCSQVKGYNTVTLTGECADEIFGGYPWFHSREAFEGEHFPWTPSMEPRKQLLSDDMLRELPLEEYAHTAYERTVKETPQLFGESAEEARRREISYLNLRWFMVTLLDRMDRTSMHSGLEARVPFADHRIVEYLWNVPWEMKSHGGIAKALLRHAAAGLVPEEVLGRKKSPYPKTYDPAYEKLLGEKLKEVISEPQAPVRSLLDTQKVRKFLDSPSDYGKPWYGQLMAGPQMLAYILQINYWLEKYQIQIL